MFFSRARSYPVMVSSFIKYDAGEEKAKLEKMKADDLKGMEVFELPERDWRGMSYKPLLKPQQQQLTAATTATAADLAPAAETAAATAVADDTTLAPTVPVATTAAGAATATTTASATLHHLIHQLGAGLTSSTAAAVGHKENAASTTAPSAAIDQPSATGAGTSVSLAGPKDDYFLEQEYLYDPDTLDDPNLLYGAHRYVLQRSRYTGPILSSIICYVNKRDLKETINEQFREKHSYLPPSLTLSKIRNLKKQALLLAVRMDLELSTLAMAFIHFERLVLKGIVTKYNRKLTMAACLLLAYKFNESSMIMMENYQAAFTMMFNYFDSEWDLPKSTVFEAEFGSFVQLNFLLHIPYKHIHIIFGRLVNSLNQTMLSYLKEEMWMEVYLHDIWMIEKMNEQQLLLRAQLLQHQQEEREKQQQRLLAQQQQQILGRQQQQLQQLQQRGKGAKIDDDKREDEAEEEGKGEEDGEDDNGEGIAILDQQKLYNKAKKPAPNNNNKLKGGKSSVAITVPPPSSSFAADDEDDERKSGSSTIQRQRSKLLPFRLFDTSSNNNQNNKRSTSFTLLHGKDNKGKDSAAADSSSAHGIEEKQPANRNEDTATLLAGSSSSSSSSSLVMQSAMPQPPPPPEDDNDSSPKLLRHSHSSGNNHTKLIDSVKLFGGPLFRMISSNSGYNQHHSQQTATGSAKSSPASSRHASPMPGSSVPRRSIHAATAPTVDAVTDTTRSTAAAKALPEKVEVNRDSQEHLLQHEQQHQTSRSYGKEEPMKLSEEAEEEDVTNDDLPLLTTVGAKKS